MARRGKQILSAVCALALLCALVLPAARADTPTIYLMAENDRMLTLPLDAMPAWVGGVLYVPYLAFDRTVTGVNLGVSYGQEHTESTYTFTLYSLRGTLVFDLNAGTCVDQLNGTSLDMRAVQRNGRVFLPLAGVCSFFGLNYTYTPTQYGTLIRITNGQEWLSTQDFVSTASGDAMRTRYYEYLRQLEGDSQETSTPQTPGESTGGETEQEGLPVYLAVRCTGAGGLESILDSLGDRGARALFLFQGSALADSADQLRRLVGTGHAVGLSVSGASLETARAELEEGTALLEELAHLGPTPSIWRTPPPAWPTPWRRRAGCAGRPMWTPGTTGAAPAPRPPPCSRTWRGGAAPPGCCWTTAPRVRPCWSGPCPG